MTGSLRKNEKSLTKEVRTLTRKWIRVIPFLDDLLVATSPFSNGGKTVSHDARGRKRKFIEKANLHHANINSRIILLNSESCLHVATQILDLEDQDTDISVKETESKANLDLDMKNDRKKTSSPFPNLGLFPWRNSTNSSMNSFQIPFYFNSHSERVIHSSKIACEKNSYQSSKA